MMDFKIDSFLHTLQNRQYFDLNALPVFIKKMYFTAKQLAGTYLQDNNTDLQEIQQNRCFHEAFHGVICCAACGKSMQAGMSIQSHDAGQRFQDFLCLFGGLVIAFAKEILTAIGAA